jgi:threonine/homoserine/homoserine lactone efflux protein
VAIGNFLNALGAALGLAVLFAWSAAAFTVVKLAGAAWLLWMGWQLLRAPATTAELPAVPQLPASRVLRDGLLVALLNPKTTLFFAAFLPQFMTPGGHHAVQSVTLGAVFVLIAGITDTAYVLFAAPLAPRLQRARRARVWSQRGAGAALVALGLLTAASQRPGR